MREAADRIRTEVGHLMGDVGRLRERVLKLQQHFDQANEDVRQILDLVREGRAARHRASRISISTGQDEPIPRPSSPAPDWQARRAPSNDTRA